MANKGTGFDLRRDCAVIAHGRKKGGVFQVTGFETLEAQDERLPAASSPIGQAAVGLTGRDLILKYTRVPPVPDWQLAKLMDFEVQEISTQAGGELAFDYNLLPVANEMTGEDTILLALAKTATLDEAANVLRARGGEAVAYTPNPVALYNAFLTCGPVTEGDTELIAWIGETSIDLVLVRGANLLFARNVSGGLQILDGAIAQAFNVREPRARRIRGELLNMDPRARGSYGSSQEEKATHAVQGVAGQLLAALRSTLAFCQSQIGIQDTTLKRGYICGPGAAIRGLDRFFADGMGCPIEVWNPVAGLDLSTCPPEDAAALEASGPESALALGLAMQPCFDELYSIEILPESTKKKRRFKERTVFNIVAALVLVGFLGWHFTQSKASKELYDGEKTRVERIARTAKSIDSSTTKVAEANSNKHARLAELEEIAVPLHSAVRILRELRAMLPSDLYILQVKSERAVAPWLKKDDKEGKDGRGSSRSRRAPQRTYIHVKGGGTPISGADLATTYRRFVAQLKSRKVPVFEATTSQVGGFKFEFKVDYLVPEADEKGD